jgi:hypothetical protein
VSDNVAFWRLNGLDKNGGVGDPVDSLWGTDVHQAMPAGTLYVESQLQLMDEDGHEKVALVRLLLQTL